MLTRFTTVFAAAVALAGCHSSHKQHSSLNPDAEQKATADLQESIDNYRRTAPRIREFRTVLNPNMEALQGDPNDPVPSNIGLLKAVPPSPQSGLEAFSPIIVKAVQARLRDSLHREPTVDEVVAEITTVESRQITEIGDLLESRHAEIAALYAEIASLNRQGKTDQARKKLRDLRMIRQEASTSWYQANGIAPGKSDTPQQAVTPEQAVAANRDLLFGYLNNGVTHSR